jgi:hypothetical protein
LTAFASADEVAVVGVEEGGAVDDDSRLPPALGWDRHVELRRRREQALERRARPMAEERAGAAREYGGHAARVGRQA